MGFDRFEFFLAENEKEVKCIVEEAIKQGEKVRHINEDNFWKLQRYK